MRGWTCDLVDVGKTQGDGEIAPIRSLRTWLTRRRYSGQASAQTAEAPRSTRWARSLSFFHSLGYCTCRLGSLTTLSTECTVLLYTWEAAHKASIVDLRYRRTTYWGSGRNEDVSIVSRGQTQRRDQAVNDKPQMTVQDHPFFKWTKRPRPSNSEWTAFGEDGIVISDTES